VKSITVNNKKPFAVQETYLYISLVEARGHHLVIYIIDLVT